MSQHHHINHLYQTVLADIMRFGSEVSPRGLLTRELAGVRYELLDPAANLLVSPLRKLNYTFQLAEWLWIMGGHNRLDVIEPYNKVISQFSDDGTFLYGAYGPKFVEQLPYVLQTLRRDPSSRQAIITLWRERPGTSKDVPCTLSLQFLLRADGLRLITYMRSNDAWLGLPYDLFVFTQIQRYVAALLEVRVASYVHFVGSLHLYEQHFDKAKEVVKELENVTWEPRSLALNPMPKSFRTMWEGLTLIGQMNDATPEEPTTRMAEIMAWIDPNVRVMYKPWSDYLLVLASRFVKTTHILPDLYKDLITGRTDA